MKKWEYKIDSCIKNFGISEYNNTNFDTIEDWLNEQGINGWELVSTTAIGICKFYFKRELK